VKQGVPSRSAAARCRRISAMVTPIASSTGSQNLAVPRTTRSQEGTASSGRSMSGHGMEGKSMSGHGMDGRSMSGSRSVIQSSTSAAEAERTLRDQANPPRPRRGPAPRDGRHTTADGSVGNQQPGCERPGGGSKRCRSAAASPVHPATPFGNAGMISSVGVCVLKALAT
jgi:hypothetical protein